MEKQTQGNLAEELASQFNQFRHELREDLQVFLNVDMRQAVEQVLAKSVAARHTVADHEDRIASQDIMNVSLDVHQRPTAFELIEELPARKSEESNMPCSRGDKGRDRPEVSDCTAPGGTAQQINDESQAELPHGNTGSLVSTDTSWEHETEELEVQRRRLVTQVYATFNARTRTAANLSVEEMQPSSWHVRARLRMMVRQAWFDFVASLFIVLNMIVLCVQVQIESSDPDREYDFYALELIFCTIFTCELLLRIDAFGCRYFMSFGHLFDIVLVAIQFLDVVLMTQAKFSPTASSEGGLDLDALRTWRIVKCFRAFRLVRVVTFVHELSNIVYLLSGSFVPFLWTVAFVLMVTLLAAIVVTQSVTSQFRQFPQGTFPEDRNLYLYFGSLWNSFLSLLQAITGGVNWRDMYMPLLLLQDKAPHAIILFILYIGFNALVLMNLVTGLFVDTAARMREKDSERDLRAGLHDAAKVANVAFDEPIDSHGFKRLLKTRGMLEFMDSYNLEVETVYDVFCLEREARGKQGLSLKKFVSLCAQMRGLGNALRVMSMHLQGAKDRRVIKQRHKFAQEERDVLQILIRNMSAGQEQLIKDVAALKAGVPRQRTMQAERKSLGYEDQRRAGMQL